MVEINDIIERETLKLRERCVKNRYTPQQVEEAVKIHTAALLSIWESMDSMCEDEEIDHVVNTDDAKARMAHFRTFARDGRRIWVFCRKPVEKAAFWKPINEWMDILAPRKW